MIVNKLYAAINTIVVKIDYKGNSHHLAQNLTRSVTQEIIEMLEEMMPPEVDIKDFTGTNIVDAVEWGQNKQKLIEREIYLRRIKELKAGL